MRAVKNHADESNTRKSNMRLYRYRRGHPMNPYPYGRALTPGSGHGICGYAASGSVAGVWFLS